MNRWMPKLLILLLTGSISISVGARAGDYVNWRKSSVDADVLTWDTLHVLERVAEATGWQIYIEPGAQKKFSTKFKERAPDKALDLLLGNLGRVLLPGTNGGPPRLLVFKNKEKDATQLVRPKPVNKAKPLAKELIVTMKKGKSIDDLAKKLGARVKNRADEINAGRLEFESEEAANAARDLLRDNEDVASVDLNYPVNEEPQPENASSSGPNLNLKPIKDGDGVIIGLIDSAVQGSDPFLIGNLSVAGESALDPSHPSHGTAMKSALQQGMASAYGADSSGSGVRILSVDVFGNNEGTTTFELSKGIYEAMKKGATIINMSLGGDGDTPFLHEPIKIGSAKGVAFIASAGNTPTTDPTFPAAYDEVIAVTAGDGRGGLASYANRGAFVDVIAPGTTLITFNGKTYRVTGTSPAAAYISGLIAGTADASGKSPAAAATAVTSRAPTLRKN